MLKEPVIALAHWWHCACLKCVSGLRRLKKTLNFLRCIHIFELVLKYGWHKWRKVDTSSLLLHRFDGYSCLRYWNVFFQLFFRFYIEVFSYCILTETFASGFQKWFGHEWIDFRVFLDLLPLASSVDLLSVWTENCKNCSILFLFDNWQHQSFSIFSFRVILVCSLKSIFLTIGFCNINRVALGMQWILTF